MTAQGTASLKTSFENGDEPQGSDFANLIDSFVSNTDTTAQSIASSLFAPELNSLIVSASAVFANAINTPLLTATLVTADTVKTSALRFTTIDTTCAVSAPMQFYQPFRVKSGNNGGGGVVTLVSGTAFVTNSFIGATSIPIISRGSASGTLGHLQAKIESTGFRIISNSSTETSKVFWLLTNPSQ